MQSEANSQCPSDLLGVSSAKLYRHRVEPAIVGCRRASLSPLVGIGHLRLASLVDERVPRYSNRLFPDDEEARRFAAGVQAVFVRQQIKVDGLLFFPFGRYCNDDMGATTAAARERIMASVYGYMASVARIPAIEDGECLRLLCVAADAAIFESGLGEVEQRAAAHDLAALFFLPTIMQANHRRVKAIGLSRSLARMSAKDMLAKAATIGASAGAPCGDGWLQILRVLHGEDRACDRAGHPLRCNRAAAGVANLQRGRPPPHVGCHRRPLQLCTPFGICRSVPFLSPVRLGSGRTRIVRYDGDGVRR